MLARAASPHCPTDFKCSAQQRANPTSCVLCPHGAVFDGWLESWLRHFLRCCKSHVIIVAQGVAACLHPAFFNDNSNNNVKWGSFRRTPAPPFSESPPRRSSHLPRLGLCFRPPLKLKFTNLDCSSHALLFLSFFFSSAASIGRCACHSQVSEPAAPGEHAGGHGNFDIGLDRREMVWCGVV